MLMVKLMQIIGFLVLVMLERLLIQMLLLLFMEMLVIQLYFFLLPGSTYAYFKMWKNDPSMIK